MADGEINRNGATIRIDDDGGVQVEPAPGQEVEYTAPDLGTEAIRESVEANVTESIEYRSNLQLLAEEIDTEDDLSGETTATLTGLGERNNYVIRVQDYDQNSSLFMYFNGEDDASSYDYWDETGTKITSQDRIELVDCAFPRLGGHVLVAGHADRGGFDNRLHMGRPENIDGFAQKGGWNSNAFINTVTFETEDGDGYSSTTEFSAWKLL